jgi:signal transduction histidine kinase
MRAFRLFRRSRPAPEVRAAGRRSTDHAIESIREDERAFIARELHDDLGQLLATLRVDVNLLMQRDARERGVREQLEGMDRRLLSAIVSLRRIASNLRPLALDEGGLYLALGALRDEFEQRHGITCLLDAQEAGLQFDDYFSTAVYRIVQESLTNVARHAAAESVHVVLRREAGALHIDIEDDGRGIRPADFRKGSSFGLLGMRERVQALRGEIEIAGGAAGTRIHIRLPLPGTSSGKDDPI